MPRQTTTLQLLAIFSLLLLSACADDDSISNLELDSQLTESILGAVAGGTASLQLPESDDYAAIPQDPRNPLTAEKIALGKLLFHETALGNTGMSKAMTGTYSCASCHTAAAGFQAGRWQGIGEGGVGFGQAGEGRTRAANVATNMLDVQPLRSPSILHAGYQRVTLWNGQFGASGLNESTEANWTPGTPKAVNELGFEGVETQAIAGLDVHRMDVDDIVLDELGYRDLFDAAFPATVREERYNRVTAGLAIAAYERTVLANRAPFQRWLSGEPNAMTDSEKRGAIAFFGDGNCASCHSGPALSSETFHALGMNDLHDIAEPVFGSSEQQSAHKGRGGFTMRSEDMYAFKTPQLYNLSDSRFYGHGASLRSVRDVIEYKRKAIHENGRVATDQLSQGFVPLALSDAQVNDLTAFIEDALHDDQLSRYEPSATLSGSCFPNADALSRADRGCE